MQQENPDLNSESTATSQSYAQRVLPGEALAEVREALDGGMGGMDDTAAWWYERVQVLVAEFDQLCRAASNAERYLATLPGDPDPGDPRMVNIWAALRKAVRPYERAQTAVRFTEFESLRQTPRPTHPGTDGREGPTS